MTTGYTIIHSSPLAVTVFYVLVYAAATLAGFGVGAWWMARSLRRVCPFPAGKCVVCYPRGGTTAGRESHMMISGNGAIQVHG